MSVHSPAEIQSIYKLKSRIIGYVFFYIPTVLVVLLLVFFPPELLRVALLSEAKQRLVAARVDSVLQANGRLHEQLKKQESYLALLRKKAEGTTLVAGKTPSPRIEARYLSWADYQARYPGRSFMQFREQQVEFLHAQIDSVMKYSTNP